ncbi:hypothetical protein ACOMHN_023211 [Nucella lapillus]
MTSLTEQEPVASRSAQGCRDPPKSGHELRSILKSATVLDSGSRSVSGIHSSNDISEVNPPVRATFTRAPTRRRSVLSIGGDSRMSHHEAPPPGLYSSSGANTSFLSHAPSRLGLGYSAQQKRGRRQSSFFGDAENGNGESVAPDL